MSFTALGTELHIIAICSVMLKTPNVAHLWLLLCSRHLRYGLLHIARGIKFWFKKSMLVRSNNYLAIYVECASLANVNTYLCFRTVRPKLKLSLGILILGKWSNKPETYQGYSLSRSRVVTRGWMHWLCTPHDAITPNNIHVTNMYESLKHKNSLQPMKVVKKQATVYTDQNPVLNTLQTGPVRRNLLTMPFISCCQIQQCCN